MNRIERFTVYPILVALCVAVFGGSLPTPAAQADDGVGARVAAMERLLKNVTRMTDPNTNQDTIRFSAMNVQIVSGSGQTSGDVNGTGNLIVGYNELRGNSNGPNVRTGSHMLIVGKEHNYSSCAGVVMGWRNTASSYYASVHAGSDNTASGTFSSISGGTENTASGEFATIKGGRKQTVNERFGSR